MAGRLLLRACTTTLRLRSNAVARPLHRAMATEGIPTDEEQATGLERRVLMAFKEGKVEVKPAGKLNHPRLLAHGESGRQTTFVMWKWIHPVTEVISLVDPYSILKPKYYPGTKEDPQLVPCIGGKRLVGCLCEEDNTAIVWFWVHEGGSHRCPSCGTYYKAVPHEVPH